MRKDQMDKFKALQEEAGIAPDDRGLLLEEVKAKDGSQKAMKDALYGILQDLSPIAGKGPNAEPRRGVRTLVLTGREGTGKTFLACSALNTVLSWCYDG